MTSGSIFTEMMGLLPNQPPRPPPGLVALLAEVGYKPGWRFEVVAVEPRQPWDPWALRITASDQLDARAPAPACGEDPGRLSALFGPARRITLLHQIPIPHYLDGDEAFWAVWLRESITVAEGHEIDEWLTVGGERPFDPHRVRLR